MMNKILMSLAAVSAFGAAAPAAAQHANSNIDARMNELRTSLQAGVQNGRITRTEAVQLRAQLQQLNQLERRFSRNGLSRTERDQLQQRIQTLRQQIREAERDGTRSRYDRNDDRFGDRRDCPPGLAKKNDGCVPPGQVGRVGSRYDNSWGRVPSQWQNQYRDSDRFIYRYNNGRIYQVDQRTGNIVRIIERR